MAQRALDMPYKTARRWAVAMGGLAFAIAACAIVLLPGPAFLVISAALAVVGIELAWARQWLRSLRERAGGVDGSRTGP